ncbi:uncharacterized protein TNCV_2028771 [Trichonephila clavipes]|nr:uncharacterized protein TNCV_2028771 [Trichonephila clavipes]
MLSSRPGAIYQQDNARPHTARLSQQCLQGYDVLPWPARSPDLSPIEHGEIGASLEQFYNVGKSTITDIKKGPSNAAVRDSYGVVGTTTVLSYSTTAAPENQGPCSEKTKVYNGAAKNDHFPQ